MRQPSGSMSTPKSIITRVGDRGTTRLFSGEEVSKNSPRPCACGEVDELVSALGLARAHVACDADRGALLHLQRTLFHVGAEVATMASKRSVLERRLDASAVEDIEHRCAAAEKRVDLPDGFVVPGGNPGAAFLDHARAVARRCERRLVGLHDAGQLRNEFILVWMNRLSDYLWLMARIEEGTSTPVKE